MKRDKLSFPNQLSSLEQRLRADLDDDTFKEVAKIILRYEPMQGDSLIIGLENIAKYTGLTLNKIKKLSPDLQYAGVLRKINKIDGKQKRQVVVGYASHLREHFKKVPASQKEVFKQMRRKARYHDCPKCDYRIYV